MSAPNSQDSDDELDDCPICVEPFDESDRLFLPCQCNYRVCMFCVRRLMTEFDGRCPGCRSVYNEENFRIREMDPEEMEKRRLKEKQRIQERIRQQQAKQNAGQALSTAASAAAGKNFRATNAGAAPAGKKTTGGGGGGAHLSPLGGPQQSGNQNLGHSQFSLDQQLESVLAQQRKNLAMVRVVQNHVVFVLGLPLSLAKEDILRRPEHFGQYGPIVKIVVGHPAPTPGRTASASAHITFARTEDAREAIRGVDGVVVDGHQIRASFGTTRYCHAFLRGQQCGNPECLFLHQEVDSSAQTMPNTMAAAPRTNGGLASAPSTGGGGAAAAAAAGHTGINHHHHPHHAHATFGGTDPFALENVPEPLNGIDLAQYEKQRNRNAPPNQTMSRAPGEGRPPRENPLLGPSPQTAVSYDCALSLVADLVSSRGPMHDDLRRKLSWITGPRVKSSQFSGLECVLASAGPLFIAPVAIPDGDTMSSSVAASSAVPVGQPIGSESNAAQAAMDASKDKKLTRKGKKAAFAAQNRIGSDSEAF